MEIHCWWTDWGKPQTCCELKKLRLKTESNHDVHFSIYDNTGKLVDYNIRDARDSYINYMRRSVKFIKIKRQKRILS